ncbi:hypothetical protein M406DRAFT_69611 [Cryphonectria parasitica EP155]|uniref:Heterokaryon incompatibility domain-containing protein n=1 Tax=Cryphonectria parasitica (strain ATCC 38755 / EP155) TaxID=660469 RepID=A0A9P4Y5U4_CRYP1|nr:uncharacterized protein M406DRAFT_69611 [Cryphonectria parasitica EP155]KAF3767467.1 hypothetical protein M406DRAFT_69611 [Cryphonectria parasitica EP155]
MARHPVDKSGSSNQRTGPNQQLCERCRPWDDLVSISSGINPLRLGYPIAGSVDSTLQSMLSNTHCLVCQALSKAIQTRLAHEQRTDPNLNVHDVLILNYGPYFLHSGCHEQASPDNGSGGSWMVDWSDPTCTRLRLIIKLDIFCSRGDDMLAPLYMTPQFCLRHARSKPTMLIGVDPWEVPYFDTSLLRSWIHTCDGIHGHEKIIQDAGTGPLPPDFRVIDVERMKVTRPVEPRGFVALSYMWQTTTYGGGMAVDIHDQLTRVNRTRLEAEGGLGSIHLPPIITDAIALCRSLGERYLWVDRLCIVQDDAESKHGQIGAMDTIYSTANFTIMAALDSRDGSAGLPGCSGRPRVSSVLLPPRACEGSRRGILPVGLRKVVDVCEWNKRGWTFQERLLSRRRLFITESQVIFQCSSGTAYEELSYLPRNRDAIILGDVQGVYPVDKQTADVRENMEKRRQHRLQMPGFEDLYSHDSRTVVDGWSISRYEIGAPTDLQTYFESVSDYTARQLSFPSDILNAFTGVANAFGRDLCTRMLFGLPERHLVHSLMWSRARVSNRPQTADDNSNNMGLVAVAGMPSYIPSWSWASAGHPADYNWSDDRHYSFKLTYVVPLVYLYVHDPSNSGGLRMLDQDERPWSEEDDWTSTDTWSDCPHTPAQKLAHRALDPATCAAAMRFLPGGALVFNTTTADLWVEQEARRNGTAKMGRIVAPATGETVGYLSGASAGWIASQQHSVVAAQRTTFKFVVLSAGVSNGRPWSGKSSSSSRAQSVRLLHVMLVEPVPGEPLAMRRVEVGFVNAEMWKSCAPRWETVVLC